MDKLRILRPFRELRDDFIGFNPTMHVQISDYPIEIWEAMITLTIGDRECFWNFSDLTPESVVISACEIVRAALHDAGYVSARECSGANNGN